MDRGSSGGSNGSSSFMVGFGENNGLSPMMLNNSGTSQILEHNKLFLPLSWTSSNSGQRVSCFISQSNIDQNNSNNNNNYRAKIMSHPLFPRLLTAYVNCQKVGAPPEVVARLEQACAASVSDSRSTGRGDDPALDQFMEAYCEMLIKYEQELSKPFKEAMVFFSRIESQLKALAVSSNSDACEFGSQNNDNQSSKELEVDVNENYIDPQAEDKELKGQLLRKYSGYLGNLKQEFLKKKKNGKLPKEARQQLLDWWSRHYKWPYPSESQKVALAESTGLDLKQINNWFINQRKRHWKPSEEMQFVVMDANHPHYYLDNVICNPFSMDCSSTLL